MTNIFLYGTLCDRELLEVCLGRSLDNVNLVRAELENHSVFWVKNNNFPVIKFNRGSFAKGLAVLDLEDHDLNRLDFYEGGFNYELRKSSIILNDIDYFSKNKIEAYVYFNNDKEIEIGKDWDLVEWQRCYGLISRLVAKEYMPLRRSCGEIDLLAEYEQIYNRLSENL
ncbi:MAG: gamma-glutamylcyclotransferase family protein [Paracoccaceae bacterium]